MNSCCNSYNRSLNCNNCNYCCNLCKTIDSPITKEVSQLYASLENNYPINRCLCNDFGTNPRYYNPMHVPCNCKNKCFLC